MGKKRRILTRTTKFVKKYFEFLDKADGTDDNIIDTSSGRGDAYVDTIKVKDNEDESVTVSGRLFGFKASDKVEVSVDEGTFANETAVTVDSTPEAGLDGVTYSVVVGLDESGLGKGSHSFTVRKKDATKVSFQKKATANVRENKIVLDLAEGCFSDSGDNNINFDATKLTITSGKKQAGSATAAVLGGAPGAAGAIGVKIEILHGTDAQTINDKNGANGATSQTVAKNAAFGAGENISDMLATDMDQANQVAENVAEGQLVTFVARVTPIDNADTVLADSAVEQTFTVERKA